MAIPQYDLSDAITNSIKRVNALFEVYRHKEERFTAVQRVSENLDWKVFDNKLLISYAHFIRDKDDRIFEVLICSDFNKCFLMDKEIKKIVEWFTEEVVRKEHPHPEWNKKV